MKQSNPAIEFFLITSIFPQYLFPARARTHTQDGAVLPIGKKETDRAMKAYATGKKGRVSLFFTQIASSAYYGVLVTKFLHAGQSLCPFYIPVLKQSALEQSRLPRTFLLHRDS